jgi:hypothetical protein
VGVPVIAINANHLVIGQEIVLVMVQHLNLMETVMQGKEDMVVLKISSMEDDIEIWQNTTF